jgi:hypothetical protein
MDTEQTTDVRELSDDELNLVAGGFVSHLFWILTGDFLSASATGGIPSGRGQDPQAA